MKLSRLLIVLIFSIPASSCGEEQRQAPSSTGTAVSSDLPQFDPTDFSSRVWPNNTSDEGCGESTALLRDDLMSFVSSPEIDQFIVASGYDICNSTTTDDGSELPAGDEIQGYFVVTTSFDHDRAYWAFAFSGDLDISDAVFGDQNLVVVRADQSEVIPFNISSPRTTGSIVTFILVDAEMRYSASAQFTSHISSGRIYLRGSNELQAATAVTTGSELTNPDGILAGSAVGFMPGEVNERSNFEFVAEDSGGSEPVTYIAIDFIQGKLIPLNCNNISSGMITVLPTSSAIKLDCMSMGGFNAFNVVVSISYDFFNLGGAFGDNFARPNAPQIIRD